MDRLYMEFLLYYNCMGTLKYENTKKIKQLIY